MVEYFSSIPSAHRAALLIFGLVFFWIIEGIIPIRKMLYSRSQHWALNMFFTITTIIINFIFAGLILYISENAAKKGFGILQWIKMPFWINLIIGLLILDFISAYFIHFIEHKIRLFWRFHLIHHTDTWVDVSTGNRHHPGESILRAAFTTIAVAIAGAPMWMVMLYQSMSVVMTQFNHANINIPESIDKILRYFMVTPRMHRIHHHYTQPYTDSNYGNIFSIWDRVFGTYKYLSEEKIVFGIDTHMLEVENNRIINLLKIPFQKYRSPITNKIDE
jgi:sterol desaturase/sphingolipid hydroxylase (fatty acid hydroxylase superfamily)